MASPCVVLVLGGEFHGPLICRTLGNHQWKWGFTELNETAVVLAIGYDQVSSDFANAVLEVPDSLALANGPPRLLEIDFGQRGSRFAAEAGQKSDEEKNCWRGRTSNLEP